MLIRLKRAIGICNNFEKIFRAGPSPIQSSNKMKIGTGYLTSEISLTLVGFC